MTDDREEAARDVAQRWVEGYSADEVRPEMEDALNRLAAAHGLDNPRIDPLDGPLFGVPYVADPETPNTYRPQSS